MPSRRRAGPSRSSPSVTSPGSSFNMCLAKTPAGRSRSAPGSAKSCSPSTATRPNRNNPMPTFVGIDLGTTNSVVAARNAYGRPEVIPNREGRNITPSVVYFGAQPPAVGDEAKEWARLGNDEIASFFKPHMGSPLYNLRFHGRDYDATDLSALVLRR